MTLDPAPSVFEPAVDAVTPEGVTLPFAPGENVYRVAAILAAALLLLLSLPL